MNLKDKIYSATWLTVGFIIALMLPIAILTWTEKNPFWISLVAILLPLGFYSCFMTLSKWSGKMIWWGFIFVFFSAFQIVLSYLFGNSVIATDMFLNLLTTNPGEAGELLGNIYPSVIAVVVIYIPLLGVATMHLKRKIQVSDLLRRRLFRLGATSLGLGVVLLVSFCTGDIRRVLRDEVFPINVSYNLGLAISESNKVANFDESSEGFTYDAYREVKPKSKEVYVLVIGEAARACNWQLYGYERATNPRLSKQKNLSVFYNVLTQSNTTHKSVPMMLSSIHTSEHKELYRRSGIPALFNEVGFSTYFISNQSPQGAMIDNLAHDAKYVMYMDSPRLDMQLVDAMRKALEQDRSEKILFILHTYGSHFSYYQRYPRSFAEFNPDEDVAISKSNMELIRNSYDNSILYTDHVLSEIISTLEGLENTSCAMFYCADHGEDLMDEEDERFLHASPTVTYYQLHVASLAWFSERYKQEHPDKVEASLSNAHAPATTFSVFHTMADMASIRSNYVDKTASLLNPDFDFEAERYYLSDHNKAVILDENIGINAMQRDIFLKHGIEL